jgi:C-terminal processing protease CtpA/Prc
LIDQKGTYTVLSVLPATPAAGAGIAKGESIVEVNGTPAATQSLAALRAALAGPAGTVVHLGVRNAQNAVRDVTLTLADYV